MRDLFIKKVFEINSPIQKHSPVLLFSYFTSNKSVNQRDVPDINYILNKTNYKLLACLAGALDSTKEEMRLKFYVQSHST